MPRTTEAQLTELRAKFAKLNQLQRTILALIMEGNGNKTICRAVDRCLRTVEACRSEIRDRIGARHNAEMIIFATLVDFPEEQPAQLEIPKIDPEPEPAAPVEPPPSEFTTTEPDATLVSASTIARQVAMTIDELAAEAALLEIAPRVRHRSHFYSAADAVHLVEVLTPEPIQSERGEEYTLEDIGAMLGVSRQRVEQIEKAALAKMELAFRCDAGVMAEVEDLLNQRDHESFRELHGHINGYGGSTLNRAGGDRAPAFV